MEDNTIKNQLISEIDKLKQIVEDYKKPQPDLEKLSGTMKDSAEQYETLINAAPFGIITLDENGIIVSCNKKVLNFLGQSEGEVVGKHFTKIKFLSAEDIPRYLKIFAYALSGKEGISFEISGHSKDGNIFFGEVFYGLIKRNGDVKAVQIIINDITKRKEAEEKLNFIRFHDDLTGLYNRAYFEEEIKRLDAERQLPLSFIIGDVNGLKLINDAFGVEEGDKILKDIAKAINILTQTHQVQEATNVIKAFGEDSAIIEIDSLSDEYLLLALDGMWEKLIEESPYLAGYFSILVNVNDIIVKGGKPIAVLNMMANHDPNIRKEMFQGITDGCKKFKVPMVGGHLHPDSSHSELAVSILGIVKKNA